MQSRPPQDNTSIRRIVEHNRVAWDQQVARRDRWTIPVSREQIVKARGGDWSVVLTPEAPVPRDWFGELTGARVLGLASGGGQQCPILAAAGAAVTSFDLSPAQLEQDRQVAKREGLDITCVQGDMSNLESLPSDHFDLVFHPVSNCFVPDILPVWKEVHRVLRPGGALLAGFINPLLCLFDAKKMAAGELVVRHALPYSDLSSISEQERAELSGLDEPLTFGHTLTDQIGGQTTAGLAVTGFYEDRWGSDALPLDQYSASFVATRAIKGVPPSASRARPQ